MEWFSTPMILQLFNSVPYVPVTPNHKIICCCYNFATFMNCNINLCFFLIVLGDPCERVF